jgi:hypothetical protein
MLGTRSGCRATNQQPSHNSVQFKFKQNNSNPTAMQAKQSSSYEAIETNFAGAKKTTNLGKSSGLSEVLGAGQRTSNKAVTIAQMMIEDDDT